MPINIGGIGNLDRCFVGDSEVLRIYANNTYSWPSLPRAKVELLSSAIAEGDTNTFGPHEPGDLLVVAARSTTNTMPGVPEGFKSAHSSTGGLALRIGYRIATTSKTEVGRWSSTAVNSVYVFRNANTTTPFGGIASWGDSKPLGPSITPQDTTGDTVMIYGYSNNGTSAGLWGAAPAGLTYLDNTPRMANLQKNDSTSDGAKTLPSPAGLVNYRNWVFEVLPDTGAPS